LRFSRRPNLVCVPTVRAALERAGLPGRLFAFAVEVMAEKRRLDIFAELTRCFMPRERNQADAVRFWRLPLTVKPRTGNHEIRVVGILFFRVAKNLPRSPGVFLIPESGHVQVGNG